MTADVQDGKQVRRHWVYAGPYELESGPIMASLVLTFDGYVSPRVPKPVYEGIPGKLHPGLPLIADVWGPLPDKERDRLISEVYPDWMDDADEG